MKNKKIILVHPLIWTFYTHRKELIQEMLIRDIEVVVVGSFIDKLTGFGNQVNSKNELQKLKVRYIDLPMSRRSINPLTDFKTYKFLINLFKKENPDMVLNYTIKPIIYGSLAAHHSGIKNIYSVITGLGYVFGEDSIKQKILRKFVKILYKIALNHNNTIFFQNPDDEQTFLEIGLVNKNQTQVVNGSGVNLETFKPSETINTNTKPIFLLISRLSWSKGVGVFVEAAKKIKKIDNQVEFFLLGPLENIATEININNIEEWETQGILKYLGSTDDVRPFIKDCSVFVLPSAYREGTPRVILEAMAMGKAIITTDSPGCKETVVSGENGYLIPVGNSDALAMAMLEFVKNPAKCNQMGKVSRKIAEEKYNVFKVNNTMLSRMNL